MDTLKKRSSNFTNLEKENLLQLVKHYFSILENKKTNAVFNKEKLNCWEKLARDYNSTQTSGLRTGGQLKSAYEQLKKKAKQHKAQDKAELVKTGGGIFTATSTVMDEKVLELIDENFFSINNVTDSNNFNDTINFIEAIDDIDIEDEPLAKRIKVCEEIEVKSSHNLLPAPHTSKSRQTVEWKKNAAMNNKKFDVLNQKSEILNIIKETEQENLKGKKLDNEIKEIIKEKLELAMKQFEYNALIAKSVEL